MVIDRLQSASSAVIAQQLAHRSIRAFTEVPIAREILEALIRAGQAAATSSFVQAYSVIRVTRPEVRQAIAALAGGQVWVEQAAEFLVYCADLRRGDLACRQAGLGALEGYVEHGLAAVVDVALMAQNVLLAAESLGLGGVFIGGIRNDLPRVAELLEIPERVVPVFGMCLGWPADSPEQKPRMPMDLILHQEIYQEPSEQALRDYDRLMSDYYQTRASNRKQGVWSEATAKALQGKKRPGILAFLRRQGFFLR
ncbi:oxygen-insensitive NADPH nitroreductase [Thiocystis violacea]|uniref:oxygen-insensitive NADPH nitroreductase n=1 Tax=Thiocystis violacea TaxID=13725 RepID=UPI0019070F96|nr:oxygen-insensitive NADPH nitroreductase [Thiocystis violacea]MBK1723085.1 nitroreductase A [Thiocystis violacea]